MAMEYFPIYFSDLELIRHLSHAQAGKVLIALLQYAVEGKNDIPLSDTGTLVYSKIKQDYDRSRRNYDEKCKNYSKAALKREQEKRDQAQSGTIVQNFGEDKKKDKDKYEDKEKEKDKDNASQAAYERAGARERRGSKRVLKNNSECTIRKEDLFVPFWVVEGLDDPTESTSGDSPS